MLMLTLFYVKRPPTSKLQIIFQGMQFPVLLSLSIIFYSNRIDGYKKNPAKNIVIIQKNLNTSVLPECFLFYLHEAGYLILQYIQWQPLLTSTLEAKLLVYALLFSCYLRREVNVLKS